MNESLDASSKGAKILKLLNNIMAGGELYSCDNFTIFAKKILIKEGDIEYNKKIAIVYDEQADMVITGELGLRFIGHKMYKAKLIIQLHKENKLNQLLNPELIEKNKEYSKFCVSDENIIKACSELINEDYINKLVERINHNTQFLEELLNLKENLDPSDPNFGESFLTLETAINEIGDKIRKLRNLLEFGDSDLNSTY